MRRRSTVGGALEMFSLPLTYRCCLLSFCQLFCRSVCEQVCCKINQPILIKIAVMKQFIHHLGRRHRKIQYKNRIQKCYDWSYHRKNWLLFGGAPVLDTDSESFFPFFTIAEYGILDLLAFVTQSPAKFHDTRLNDWRRQGNESTTFWERSDIEFGLIGKFGFEFWIIFGRG